MCVWTQYDNGDDMTNILEVKNLNAYYKTKSKSVFAHSEKKQVLFDISFDVREGEIFGIVGGVRLWEIHIVQDYSGDESAL